MDNELSQLVKSLSVLRESAVKQTLVLYPPIVNRIINTKSLDENEIEHTLDALCEVAFEAEVLLLFKELCRYYYGINPQATADYVRYYREMWEETGF